MAPRTRTLQLAIAAAFLAVVIGSLGAAGYVPYVLWGYTSGAERIQRRSAEVLRRLAALRGCGRDIRRNALGAFYAGTDAEREADQARIAELRGRCASLAAAYATIIDESARTDPAREEWRHFVTVDVPEHDQAVDAVLAEAHRTVRDPAVLHRLFAVASDGDTMLERLIGVHAATAAADAAQIRLGLERLSYVYAALAGLGALGAALLLAVVLRLVRRFTRSTAERMADLEAFGSQVAHDLRGPLQTIQLGVASIALRCDDPAVQRLTRSTRAGVERLDLMIRDLLQLARSGAGKGDGATASVAAALDQLSAELRAHAERRRARLTVDVDPAATARAAPVVLRTIVSNLVDNALKYGSDARENEVAVTATASGRDVRIVVSDRGVGIPAALLPHVFEPFVRGSDRPDSYGLGLATVKRLVDEHRGRISVRSVEGEGTTVSVVLPAASPAAHAAGGGDPLPPPPGVESFAAGPPL